MSVLIACIILGLAITLSACWLMRWRRAIDRSRDCDSNAVVTEDRSTARNEAVPPDMRQRLERDLRLACEHLDGLQLLIQVAATHQQSVPPSVVTNLKFVSRHLRSLEQQVGGGREEFKRPVPTLPPDIRQDGECHASPFDRSALSG